MATPSQKTTTWVFQVLTNLVDNTLTAMPVAPTIVIPESGVTFKAVRATLTWDDIATVAGSIAQRRLDIGLGGGVKTSVVNSNTVTNSGESISGTFVQDYTAHFIANWTGTSMSCEADVLIDQSTGTTLGARNVCLTLDITYEYDAESATQVKTVWVPLNSRVTSLTTSEGTATVYTVPELDAWPEASKTFLQRSVWYQGATWQSAATDVTVSMSLDMSATETPQPYEGALATSRTVRYASPALLSAATTNATHDFRMWASLAAFNHMQVWVSVTYQFDASTTTRARVSLRIPMEIASPMGGTAAGDYQRGARDIWIQEQNVTSQEIAFFVFWDAFSPIAGLSMRIGTGGFTAYTDGAATFLAGSQCAMVRNDAAFTLARGRNALNFDVYRTDTTDLGWAVSGFWMLNYDADVPAVTGGIGLMNRTVVWPLQTHSTVAALNVVTTSAQAVDIPEPLYFIGAFGAAQSTMVNTSNNMSSTVSSAERLVAEGGQQWEGFIFNIGQWDLEVAVKWQYATTRSIFWRWANDPDTNRLDPEVARRWRITAANGAAGWHDLALLLTYHAITYTVAGNVSGSAGGTVNLALQRAATGEIVATTSRSGDGAYTMTWYDDTEDVYVTAVENATHVGRSADGLAV